MSFLCRSISEADHMLAIFRDGTPVLLRHDPCAAVQSRDVLAYWMGVEEVRSYNKRQGWRTIVADYQSTPFIAGDTLEPDWGNWTFQDLSDSAPDFAVQTGLWSTFRMQTLLPRGPWPTTGRALPPDPSILQEAW